MLFCFHFHFSRPEQLSWLWVLDIYNNTSTFCFFLLLATKRALSNKKIIGSNSRSYKLQPHSFFNKHFWVSSMCLGLCWLHKLIIILGKISQSEPQFPPLFNKEINNDNSNIRLRKGSSEIKYMKELYKLQLSNEWVFFTFIITYFGFLHFLSCLSSLGWDCSQFDFCLQNLFLLIKAYY